MTDTPNILPVTNLDFTPTALLLTLESGKQIEVQRDDSLLLVNEQQSGLLFADLKEGEPTVYEIPLYLIPSAEREAMQA